MCTVTYLPRPNGYILTSNRDEHLTRPLASPPQIHRLNQYQCIYPTDAKAGGTWIISLETGISAVLLNGAFQAHTPAPSYARSRGRILLDILGHPKPVKEFEACNLELIEPFTLIIHEGHNLFECRWDGEQHHTMLLNRHKPYIWSSVTLYNSDSIKKRQQWFELWTEKQTVFLQNEILTFHRQTGEGDSSQALVMSRNNNLSTVSITSVEVNQRLSSMHYLDLKSNEDYQIQLPIFLSESNKVII
ncbi:NRDE family protein [Dyadobacter tibetensis]|uniref:NRDE family protein n=1 Tax=Dyadobacter tibetensis TaxID=1211851 RepID=UPI00047156C9|nr:NRDE family protein [Dyadobacter tibetensis]